MIEFNTEVFFPKGMITTKFGWDKFTFPGQPRIHYGIDKAGPGMVCNPLEGAVATWLIDSQGNSVIRLVRGDLELRVMHFNKVELDESFKCGVPLAAGQKIGPAGNTGISVASAGGTGRHVHYQLMLKPNVFDDELSTKRPTWKTNMIEDFVKRYGPSFTAQIKARAITWMSDVALAKFDPFDQAVRIVVDPFTFFGL